MGWAVLATLCAVFASSGRASRDSSRGTAEAIGNRAATSFAHTDNFIALKNRIVLRCRSAALWEYQDSIRLVGRMEDLLRNPTMRSESTDFRDSVYRIKGKLRKDAELHPTKRIDTRPHCFEFNAAIDHDRRKPDNPNW